MTHISGPAEAATSTTVIQRAPAGSVLTAVRHVGRPSGPARTPIWRPAGALGDGTPVSVRALVAADRWWWPEWCAALSPHTQHQRFLRNSPTPTRDLDQLIDGVDGMQHVAVVAAVPAATSPIPAPRSWTEPMAVPVAVGRFIRPFPNSTDAEVAFTVTDAWQGRGVGTLLLNALVDRALALGITSFTALMSADNRRSIRLLKHAGKITRRERDGCGAVEFRVALSHRPDNAVESSRPSVDWHLGVGFARGTVGGTEHQVDQLCRELRSQSDQATLDKQVAARGARTDTTGVVDQHDIARHQRACTSA